MATSRSSKATNFALEYPVYLANKINSNNLQTAGRDFEFWTEADLSQLSAELKSNTNQLTNHVPSSVAKLLFLSFSCQLSSIRTVHCRCLHLQFAKLTAWRRSEFSTIFMEFLIEDIKGKNKLGICGEEI